MDTDVKVLLKGVDYNGNKVDLVQCKYNEPKNTALVLLESSENEDLDGEVYAYATVNLGIQLEENQVIIKDYSENAGMLDWLKGQNVLGKYLGVIPSGFVLLQVYELKNQ